ncbi:TPA: DUF3265 domain-containing protein, partial [Vibrio vulnificus]|nr:DUF3265 domain-containing protein [Vibrio vulnificus]
FWYAVGFSGESGLRKVGLGGIHPLTQRYELEETMTLSSNSIIHFTNSENALKGILTSDFKVKYCKERVNLNGTVIEFCAPMVSFCDIPLSKVKDHIFKYGNYGIGLTKEWAERSGLNPVLYMEKHSVLAGNMRDVAFEALGDGREVEEWSSHQQQLADIIRYVKNYQDDLKRKDEVLKDYRFSDEREWRWCPPFDDVPSMMIDTNWYIKEQNKPKYDAQVQGVTLTFEPKDIKYIIIKSDSEISDFIDLLRREKGSKYTYDDIERLTTRIITTDQIMSDF